MIVKCTLPLILSVMSQDSFGHVIIIVDRPDHEVRGLIVNGKSIPFVIDDLDSKPNGTAWRFSIDMKEIEIQVSKRICNGQTVPQVIALKQRSSLTVKQMDAG